MKNLIGLFFVVFLLIGCKGYQYIAPPHHIVENLNNGNFDVSISPISNSLLVG